MSRHDETEPVFAEPWHAQLFAVTHTLASCGRFAWSDWTDHFTAALKEQLNEYLALGSGRQRFG